jgi:HEAT repeat protein
VRAGPVAIGILVLWGATAALGDDVTAPHKKAKAAGTLGSPKEDEAVGAAATSAGYGGSEADSALLRALLCAFEPGPEEIRVLAVEDLGLLGDARALNALATLVFDPSVAVQNAALHTVAQFRTPRAEEILENVVRHPRIPEPMKVKALQALPYQASSTSREFLNEIATSGRQGSAIRAAARLVLQDLQPPFVPRVPVTAGPLGAAPAAGTPTP